MLFNSLSFAIFFPVVFFLYWFVCQKNLRLQNILLLVASYFFYACWDWRFLFLLAFSTFLDYFTGLKMSSAARPSQRKFWLILSIGINLGFLGVFKYYNFFAETFRELLSGFGMEVHPATIQVILPVGISFYTFHGLSYVIDIYRKKIEPEKNLVDYSVFVAFFPLLVAGPIERATHLLPQIRVKRTFDYHRAVDGLKQILWGLFKKIVIADQCAIYVNQIFEPGASYDGSTMLLGAVLFAFQIYGDFSGYSDTALGTARLLGIELLRNFAYPYFSRDIAEFWRRWHISLSTWFRDYVYIPLGGSRGNTFTRIRNVFIIFLLSGFWHGANWTFIFWGFLNALFILPSILFKTHRDHLNIVAQGKIFPTFREFTAILLTFGLTVIAWIFFRAEDMGQAFYMLSGIFSLSLFTIPEFQPAILFGFLILFILIEWAGREHPYAIQRMSWYSFTPARWAFYFLLINVILMLQNENQEFIYFQF
jgi:D-alanyl-lipoteichoic acid acyltransferase DltB (MBOAT superfamily)